MRRALAAAVVIAMLPVGGCTDDKPKTPVAASFSPGADGIGDLYFPTYGNGGYDVGGYDLKLRYDPKSGRLEGSATVTATATQDLSRFNLDFATLEASAVTVDGAAAQHSADKAE